MDEYRIVDNTVFDGAGEIVAGPFSQSMTIWLAPYNGEQAVYVADCGPHSRNEPPRIYLLGD